MQVEDSVTHYESSKHGRKVEQQLGEIYSDRPGLLLIILIIVIIILVIAFIILVIITEASSSLSLSQ